MSGGFPRYSLRAKRQSVHSAYPPDALHEATQRLTALETTLEGLAEAQADTLAAQNEVLDRLEKQIARVGKEQFKVNATVEAQQKSADGMLEQLRDAATHRERELAQTRERAAAAREEGRLDVIRKLFPALDGLEEALLSGRRLMQRMTALAQSTAHPSFWQRLNPAHRAGIEMESASLQAISSWLEGLEFVQARQLEALAAVDVVPIRTAGCAFDPHLHVAVETVPATAGAKPGIIVSEHRRGYVLNDTVLRYAEVVVARTTGGDSL